MENDKRDPLILVYKSVKDAVKSAFGKDFKVTDAFPNPSEIKKTMPSACIQIISGSTSKSLMSDYEPHKMKKLNNGKWLVCTENLRFVYTLKISFFSDKLHQLQSISNKFMSFIEEKENYIKIPDDLWEEEMLIYTEKPPMPPSGEQNTYFTEQEWICRGKLLMEEIVPCIDIKNLKFNIQNF